MYRWQINLVFPGENQVSLPWLHKPCFLYTRCFKKSGNGRKQTNLVIEVHVNELSDLKPLSTGENNPHWNYRPSHYGVPPSVTRLHTFDICHA